MTALYQRLTVCVREATVAAASNIVRCVREAAPAADVAGATDECDHEHIIQNKKRTFR